MTLEQDPDHVRGLGLGIAANGKPLEGTVGNMAAIA